MSDYIIKDGELCHHGVVGMKWGVRRYQRKDGSLTPAGKKRYDKDMAKLKAEEEKVKIAERDKAKVAKLEAKKADLEARKKALKGDDKKSKKESDKPVKKSVKDMSDQELQAVVNRMNLEARYNQLNPPTVSRGRKFINAIGKNVIAPVATEVSKNLLKTIVTSSVEKRTGVKLSNQKKKDND